MSHRRGSRAGRAFMTISNPGPCWIAPYACVWTGVRGELPLLVLMVGDVVVVVVVVVVRGGRGKCVARDAHMTYI